MKPTNLPGALARYAAHSAASPLLQRDGRSLFVKDAASFVGKAADTPGGYTFALTTEHIDRANDRIRVAGVGLQNFASNPVVLWAHNHAALPLGKVVNIRAGRLPDGTAALLGDVVFHDTTQEAREMAELVRQGFIRFGSIGFIPLAWEEEPVSNYKESYPFTDTIRTYTQIELLEFSICNVPMNAFAGLQGAQGGAIAGKGGGGLSFNATVSRAEKAAIRREWERRGYRVRDVADNGEPILDLSNLLSKFNRS